MKSLINTIKENGSGKEEAVEEVSSNIEEACCEDELYKLPLETLTDILRHTRQVDYKTAHTILTKATAKYCERSVNVLSSLHVDEGLSELELETLLSLIPGIQIFTLLGSFTKKVEVDYEEIIENERKLRKNLEAEVSDKNKELLWFENQAKTKKKAEVDMKKKELEFLANEVNELKLQKELAKFKEIEDYRTKIDQKLDEFNSFRQRNTKSDTFRDKLKQEIEVKPKEFEESIAKVKNCVNELQKFVNESNKMIKTYEKSQKAFLKLVPKLQKKFNEIDSKYQNLIKKRTEFSVILVGLTFSGRTCLFDVLTNKEYTDATKPTVCGDHRDIINPHNQDIVKFFDTNGTRESKIMALMVMLNARVVLLCFAKNDREQFDYLVEDWVKEEMLKDKEVILVKTKIDKEEEDDKVPREEAVKFATEKGYKYFEVSAATGEGINELREYIFEITSEM